MIATAVLVLRFALAIALYSFLGWALFILWQEVRQQGMKLAEQKRPGITIIVRPAKGKESYRRFFQTEIIIGRHTHCDLSIIDEVLSAQHARVSYHHGQWWLEDLNSTNGIFLNNRTLTTPAVIITGDEFKCGNTAFVVNIDAETASPDAIQ
jgi:pSer/pThr/pTyr-binding forkhead associated (FHA) protein